MTEEAASAWEGEEVSLSSLSTLKSNLFDLAAASVFLNILGLVMPMTLLQVYDRILPNKSTGTMISLLFGVLAALVAESILGYCRSWVTSWVGARFEHKAGCLGLSRLLLTSIDAFEKEGSGVHMERMNSLGIVREFYGGQAVLAFLDLPFAVLYLSLVGLMGHWLVVVPIVLLSIFAATAARIGVKLRGAIERRMVSDDRRYNFLIEVLGGIHSVKAMAMEAQMARRYERLQEACAQGNYEVALDSSHALGVSSFFSKITMVSVVALGSLYVVQGDMTTGALAACSMLSGRAMAPLQKVLGVWTRFQTFLLARRRISELFKLRVEGVEGMPAMPAVNGRITLEGVSFRFGGEGPLVIDNVDLDIEEGECVGISGGNGSGKSTLLALMQGALRPSRGRILVDGHDVAQFDPQTVREQIAYLPQSGVLFQGTILQNITFFRPDLEDVAIEMAALLGLDEVVATMPFGFDTTVGDGAYDSLPRGIKQRIAIARALVNNPRCVLFDEANTAIDTTGDNFLRVWLERAKGKRTLVLVTHRPSLLKLADRVFDLEGGRLSPRPPRDGADRPRLGRTVPA